MGPANHVDGKYVASSGAPANALALRSRKLPNADTTSKFSGTRSSSMVTTVSDGLRPRTSNIMPQKFHQAEKCSANCRTTTIDELCGINPPHGRGRPQLTQGVV